MTDIEISLINIYYRGEPNAECIGFYVREDCNLGSFGMFLGWRDDIGTVNPANDNFFWFGFGDVKVGDHLFVYTGPGEYRRSENPDGSGNIHTLHWGRENTAFADTRIVPVLFRMDAFDVLPAPTNKPQPKRLKG